MERKLTERARQLRKTMTDAEKLLWNKLKGRQLGVKFRRQQPIGRFIVDFVSFESRLIVEVDGGQHFENKRDKERDEWLRKQGFKVIRFWNMDVLANIEGVLEVIRRSLSPSPNPSHRGRGRRGEFS